MRSLEALSGFSYVETLDMPQHVTWHFKDSDLDASLDNLDLEAWLGQTGLILDMFAA